MYSLGCPFTSSFQEALLVQKSHTLVLLVVVVRRSCPMRRYLDTSDENLSEYLVRPHFGRSESLYMKCLSTS